MIIDAENLHYTELNEKIRASIGTCEIKNCLGQRFIASGMKNKKIRISGVPGNALGSYLCESEIIVDGNGQDAVGDTMNSGRIVIDGNVGDAAGYAMRGGEIYVRGNAGYRAGIHMKAYKEKQPVIVIGGRAGSFLGEYQAGGTIIVLAMHSDGKPTVGFFPCTGMHGGKMVIRGDVSDIRFPSRTTSRKANDEDVESIKPYISEYCRLFGADEESILSDEYTVITPDNANPYRQMYVAN